MTERFLSELCGFVDGFIRVEPLIHLLQLMVSGVLDTNLHVHTARPNEGSIQPENTQEQ